ncbi:hypothetical protein BDW59DRAFT_164202 [Aspergillus cavernicola]|uniref:DUF7702 domain-containing protein n=1 Tax=Aspergillus cavernicola TaxID=176166 RepID=A0ABR4I0P1_9EURO
MSGLSIAQLAIFAVFSPPILYLIYRHRRRGFLGWGYLLAFCILRITGGGLSINSSSAGAQIISSIGLSPMLLSLDGILHEARIYRNPDLNKRVEYTFMGFFHVLIATAVAMVGVGAGGLAGSQPKPSDLTDIKVGMALLEASWVILVLWALWSLSDGNHHHHHHHHTVPTAQELQGSMLLYGVLVVLVIEEIQILYFLVAEYTQHADLNPTTGSLAVRAVLNFLPELIGTLILVFVGIQTRHVHEHGSRPKQEGHGYGYSSHRSGLV